MMHKLILVYKKTSFFSSSLISGFRNIYPNKFLVFTLELDSVILWDYFIRTLFYILIPRFDIA